MGFSKEHDNQHNRQNLHTVEIMGFSKVKTGMIFHLDLHTVEIMGFSKGAVKALQDTIYTQ